MLHALLHGDIGEAWRQNGFLLAAIPLLIPMGWLELARRKHPRLYSAVYSVPVIITVSVVLVAWWVLRNILGI